MRTTLSALLAMALGSAVVACETRPAPDVGDARTYDVDGTDGGEATEPIECGNQTCGPDEYCYRHGGCGSDPAGRDVSCETIDECIPVPDECDPTNSCGCDETPHSCQYNDGDSCPRPREIVCYAV